jgi:hypothetical protein
MWPRMLPKMYIHIKSGQECYQKCMYMHRKCGQDCYKNVSRLWSRMEKCVPKVPKCSKCSKKCGLVCFKHLKYVRLACVRLG